MKKSTRRALILTAMQKLKNIKASDVDKYRQYYSEAKFQNKVASLVDVIGENVILPMLRAYYILRSPQTPMGKKLLIMGALGYFILPIDLIPDFLGWFGFVDDLAVVTFVLKQVKDTTTPETEARAIARYTKLLRRAPNVEA